MAWIAFKGVRSNDMGVFVEKLPDRVRGKRRIEGQPIPGRSGEVHLDERAYDPITLKVALNMGGKADPDQVISWLEGYGDLVLSDDPEKCYRAIVQDEIKSTRRRRGDGANFDTVTVPFVCDPHRYQADPAREPFKRRGYLSNPGTAAADPVIEVTGSGDVTIKVGDVTVTLEGLSGTVTIDCDIKQAYKGDLDQTVEITLDQQVWPVLGLGETEIDWVGNVTEVVVYPNWRWL